MAGDDDSDVFSDMSEPSSGEETTPAKRRRVTSAAVQRNAIDDLALQGEQKLKQKRVTQLCAMFSKDNDGSFVNALWAVAKERRSKDTERDRDRERDRERQTDTQRDR